LLVLHRRCRCANGDGRDGYRTANLLMQQHGAEGHHPDAAQHASDQDARGQRG
jgi:hypothetical protein